MSRRSCGSSTLLLCFSFVLHVPSAFSDRASETGKTHASSAVVIVVVFIAAVDRTPPPPGRRPFLALMCWSMDGRAPTTLTSDPVVHNKAMPSSSGSSTPHKAPNNTRAPSTLRNVLVALAQRHIHNTRFALCISSERPDGEETQPYLCLICMYRNPTKDKFGKRKKGGCLDACSDCCGKFCLGKYYQKEGTCWVGVGMCLGVWCLRGVRM